MTKKLLIFGIWALAALGMQAQNITGRITDGTNGVAGVAVSDGVEVVTTDANGYYSLTSDKKNGYVFYTVPRGYEPQVANGYNPQFWALLTAGTGTSEEHNFVMNKVDNDKYIMLIAADTHLAKRTRDLTQFANGFIKRLNEEKSAAGSTPIYSTILGDLAWDQFWYANSYNLSNFMSTLTSNNYPITMYPVIGNHDNDGATVATDSTDFVSSAAWRTIVSPNYYSYNIGKIHYVVLDDVYYKNTDTGGSYATGIVGSRDYDAYITAAQYNWLQKDLALIDKNTTVVVEMHIPATKISATTFAVSARLTDRSTNSTTRLYNILKDYRKVYVFTGHTHTNYHGDLNGYDNIHENNVASVCGTWWWTGYYTSRNQCQDGSPAGYELVNVDGDDLSWEFHSIESNGNAQFRVYDMNAVRTYYNTDTTIKNMFTTYSSRTDNYASSDYDDYANTVVVNVFNYDPTWTVEATENGQALTVTRINFYDPLHTLCYDRARYNAAKSYTATFATSGTQHAFLIKSSTADGTINIKVTDRFGNVYTREFLRPNTFSVNMVDETTKTSGVNDVFVDKTVAAEANVFAADGVVYINSSEAGKGQIVSTSGAVISTFNVEQGVNTIATSAKGIYIVTINGRGYKVVL